MLIFSKNKINKLSDILLDIAQVVFASMVIAQLLLTTISWVIVVFGLFISVFIWISIILLPD